MFPEFEVCNTTRSTITEVPFLGTVGVLKSEVVEPHVILIWTYCHKKFFCFYVDLYRLFGNADGETEGTQLHEKFSQQLLNDHFSSSQLPEHKLIQVCFL